MSQGDVTVKTTAGLVTPAAEAVIFAVPAATPVARPADIVATVVLELVHVTWDVTLALDPSV